MQFQAQTPNSVRLKVRAACSHVPQAIPEPLPTDHLASDMAYDVRYRVDHASDGDLPSCSSACRGSRPSRASNSASTCGS